MPSIQSLRIQYFRNLTAVNLADLGPVNFFWGDNGSGKTSILEAIYFAGTGRSFRNSQLQHVIQNGKDSLCIGANVYTNKIHIPLSIQRTVSGEKSIVWDGKKTGQFAPIAQELPLQYISTMSYRFFTDGPKIRRQFFDWGMFHVKPVFYKVWKQWQKHLAQRNACLKQRRPTSEVTAWNQPLCELAEVLHQQRLELIESLEPILAEHLRMLVAPFVCKLDYDRGWDPKLTLSQVLSENIQRDYQLGYTSAGPQRADFQLLVDGTHAVNLLSQGQQKLAMYALHLSQGYLLQQECLRSPIYLIDDMASELDPTTQKAVLNHLTKELNSQLFLTGITEDIFSGVIDSGCQIYQLAQGKIQQSLAEECG